MKMTTHDVCEFCDGKMEPRVIRARFHFKSQTIYVDSVPAWVCTKCGEQYFDAPVYKRLEEIARHSSRIEKIICFPLAEYNMALA
ncbi:YgiT-type zinc finger protein [Candidatus Poribacteria bacterium]|nr:YgiT-type zinc finger protein [Candidatus Poribacteria bacterium]